LSAGSEAAEESLDDAADATPELGFNEGADLSPVSSEPPAPQIQSEAAPSPPADDLAPPPVVAAPVQVSWTGLAPPAAAAVVEPETSVTPAVAETIPAPESEAPAPVLTERTEPTVTTAPAAEVEATAPPAEKKVVWSSSPSNSTISFGPGYSSRRDDL
jgi:hypothetical protein